MKSGSVCAPMCVMALLLHAGSGARAHTQDAAAPAAPVANLTPGATQVSSAPQTPSADPRIRIHTAPATDTRDARVSIAGASGVKISMPGIPGLAPNGPNADGTPAAKRADGLIEVPNNTLGPGEALWQQNDRIDSELRQARANAFLSDRVSTLPLDGWSWGGPWSGWGAGGWGGWSGWGWSSGTTISGGWPVNRVNTWNSGSGSWRRNEPVSITPDPVNFSTASKAQRQFSEAARPRISHIEDARSRAVIQFGKVAAPKIGTTPQAEPATNQPARTKPAARSGNRPGKRGK